MSTIVGLVFDEPKRRPSKGSKQAPKAEEKAGQTTEAEEK